MKLRINPGFGYGGHFYKLVDAEASQGSMTPYEKGEFRRAYWKGRCYGRIEDLMSCVKHNTRSASLELFEQRLVELYHDTLTEMYGEEGARNFLEGIHETEYRGSAR